MAVGISHVKFNFVDRSAQGHKLVFLSAVYWYHG